MELHVFPIPIPPPTSLSTPTLWVFPVHQARALVSCIPPGLVICFTIDNIHVSMLFPQNIPTLAFSWRRKWQPTPVFLPGESHGWRSLVRYSPWGRKESDMTERLKSVP